MSTISISKRTERGNALSQLREAGSVPGVVYGPKDEPEAITFAAADLEALIKKGGESSILTLKGDDIQKDVLIHDIQTHPVSGKILHADFYVVDKTKKVQVSVPIEFIGEAPAVKTLGGSLVRVLYELEIETLPTNIPHEIVVDISSLVDFDSIIHAGSIALPEGVVLITSPEETIVLAEEAREEEPEESAEAPSIEDIERVGGDKETNDAAASEEGGE